MSSTCNDIHEPCYQFLVREQKYASDLEKYNLMYGEPEKLRIKDFKFRFIEKSDKENIKGCIRFIEEYEYLGKVAQRNTHFFASFYKAKIAGVQILSTPNSFSHLLGKENHHLEKLLSRGACASITPKNLASWQISNAISWMVKNTESRVFSGYADPEANERGQIYRACNFIELKGKFGAKAMYIDPSNPKKGWFSDREARKLSSYKKYARELDLEWQASWTDSKNRMNWKNIPPFEEELLRLQSKVFLKRCIKRAVPPKRKFIYIKGRDRRETKFLMEKFYEHNPHMRPISKGVEL